MSGTAPMWLNGEPQSGKHDIEVRGVDNTHTLTTASRVCFEKIQAIEYHVGIMKIGTVTRKCLPHLIEYWKQEAES